MKIVGALLVLLGGLAAGVLLAVWPVGTDEFRHFVRVGLQVFALGVAAAAVVSSTAVYRVHRLRPVLHPPGSYFRRAE